jgi:hypothetical protein
VSDPLSTVGDDDRGGEMIIDCDRCVMRDIACDDCVVSVLLGAPPSGEIGDAEAGALRALADGGLVPPLRMSPRSERATG